MDKQLSDADGDKGDVPEEPCCEAQATQESLESLLNGGVVEGQSLPPCGPFAEEAGITRAVQWNRLPPEVAKKAQAWKIESLLQESQGIQSAIEILKSLQNKTVGRLCSHRKELCDLFSVPYRKLYHSFRIENVKRKETDDDRAG